MASLPPLLPTPPASLKLRDTDAVESRAHKRHRPLEPPPRPEDSGIRHHREPSPPPSSRRRAGGTPPPPPFNVRRQSRSPSPYKFRRRSRSPPPSNFRRRSRSPPPSNVRRRSRSPPSVSSNQRLTERQHTKRPSAEVAVEGERSRPTSLDDSLLENRPSHSNRNCEHPETSSSTVEKRPDPAIRGDEQKLVCENQNNEKAPSRSARRKKLKRQIKAEAKKEMREHPETPSPAVEKRPDPALRGYEHQLHSEKMDGKNQSGHKHPETSSAVMEKRSDPAIRGGEQKLDCEKMDRKNQSDGKAPSRSARRKKMKRQAKKEMREAPSRNGSPKTTKRQIWAEAKTEFREMKKEQLLENIKKLQSCVWLLEKDGADMGEIMEFRSMLESTKKQYVENEAQLATEGSSAPLQVLIRHRLEKTAVPKRNELVEEVNHLKSELQTVRLDRDDQLAQAQSLMADVAKQKEVARRYGVELEDTMMRIAALEKGCLLRRETINALQIQLASTNEKLTVPSPARDLIPN